MINATFYHDPNGEITGFCVDGHARYAALGEDIVCSAVSALAQTAILGLGAFLKKESFDYTIDERGYLRCKLASHISEEERRSAKVVLYTFYLGVKSIADNYKENVRINKEV